jgi:Uma2 family endonuclease
MTLRTFSLSETSIPRKRRLTVAEFERMIAANIWAEDERIELINGELVDMSPINARHVYIVNHLTVLRPALFQK